MTRNVVLVSKLGRSINLDPNSPTTVGGDADVQGLLMKLAARHPEIDFVLFSKNSGEKPSSIGYPSNVINPWVEWNRIFKNMPISGINPTSVQARSEQFVELGKDYMNRAIGWIDCMGQHGAANSFIPQVGGRWEDRETWATPQMSFVNYCSHIGYAMRQWITADLSREITWVCFDPRNTLKIREIGYPPRKPVLAQCTCEAGCRTERYGSTLSLEEYGLSPDNYEVHGTTWVGQAAYDHSYVELCSMPAPDTIPWNSAPPPSGRFGIISNENRKNVKDERRHLLRWWVLERLPDTEIYGSWTKESQEELGRTINPVAYADMYQFMRSFRSTFTMPASGSIWATAKIWEAFAVGTPCFVHPRYDRKGHVLPSIAQLDGHEPIRANIPTSAVELARFLRVRDEEDLAAKVHKVQEDDALWRWIAHEQRAYFEAMWHHSHGGIRAIEERIFGNE